MQIQTIINSQQWDEWLKNNSQHNSFTQAWAWGDVLLSEGKKIERLAVVEGGKVLGQAQVVYSQIPFGWQYAFCPKGPVMDEKLYKVLLDFIKNKNCIFLRVEPDANFQISDLRFKKTIDVNPSATLILDLNKSESELLAEMHQKTRYNINLAQKKDLKINSEKNLAVFLSLMNQTGSRDRFKLHAKSHYEQVLNSELTSQLTVYYKNIAIATAVFVKFGNTFTYLYGASDYAHRDLMAPYLLQWEGIKMGKSGGCQWYDFFGIAPRCHAELDSASHEILKQVQDDKYDYDKNHQYAGVTRFKLGFGGMFSQTAGTVDIIIDNTKYKLYNVLRQLRRLV